MGRIRTIKPEFPQSESVGNLSRDARLLFIQLWTIVDDAGRTRASSRMLASLLYPYDEDASDLMPQWLSELERQIMIRRYVIGGNSYLEITNWLKHQKIDRPTKSRIPAFVDASRVRDDDSRVIGDGPWTVDRGPHTVDQYPNTAKIHALPDGTSDAANGSKVAFDEPKPDTVDVRILAESVGIFGMREQADMCRLLAVFVKESGLTVDGAIYAMIGRWREYTASAPSLEWQYGSSYKFFMSGKWDTPETWPRKPVSPTNSPPNPGSNGKVEPSEADSYALWLEMSETFRQQNPWTGSKP